MYKYINKKCLLPNRLNISIIKYTILKIHGSSMKYNKYLIAGVILITVALMFLFAGMASVPMADYTNNIAENETLFENGTIAIGIITPAILAVLYLYFKPTKKE